MKPLDPPPDKNPCLLEIKALGVHIRAIGPVPVLIAGFFLLVFSIWHF